MHLSTTTTYTIARAGTVSCTFSGAEIANYFARNALLSYVGNDVVLTLDPGLLSSYLPGTANLNQGRSRGDRDLLRVCRPSGVAAMASARSHDRPDL